MARRPGLGKGLEALIPGGFHDLDQPASSQNIIQIPVDKITPNPKQPRGQISREELENLAASIKEHGVIQPVIVTHSEEEDRYTLVAGERRWRASMMVGLETIPAIVRTATQQQMLELALIENIQREDLNPLERADAYQSLIDEFSFTHEDVARVVGKSRVSVTNTIRLMNLSENAQVALVEGLISEGHARTLLALPNHKAQDAALETILNHDLNVRQSESLVLKLSGRKPQTPVLKEKPIELKNLEDRLRDFFKTKVNLQTSRKGGSITIFYYSDEELNAIIDRLDPIE